MQCRHARSSSVRGIHALPESDADTPRRLSAEEFATRGCKVYATARNVEKMKGLSPRIDQVELDVTSDESATTAIETIISREGRIDVLVNSAGAKSVSSSRFYIVPALYSFTSALLDIPVRDVEQLLQTNFLGALRVTKVCALQIRDCSLC
jgi:1-acylglycerone phosphate reductase